MALMQAPPSTRSLPLSPPALAAMMHEALAEATRRQTTLPLPSTHAGQAAVLNDPRRFHHYRCGRRWRKSTTGMLALVSGNPLRPGALRKPNGLFYWVWPTGPMGQTGWDMLRRLCGGRWALPESRRRATAPNGAEIWVKSADHEDGLRSPGLDGVVFTECREIRGRAWHEIVRPALADKKGWADFESTPRGYDWFHDLEMAAAGRDDWATYHFTSYDNPAIDPAELEAAKADMTERMFRQEIMADYLKDGAYFQHIDEGCTLEKPDAPADHAGHSFVMGVDWGKSNDWTVLTVICRECSRVVDWWRFNEIDYIVQRERLKLLAERWPECRILPERNSIGEPNIEMLRADGLRVEVGPDNQHGFATTAASKAALIEALALALNQQAIKVPRDYAPELRAFEITTRDTGVPKFSAPEGTHDDCVMSLALAWRLATVGLQIWL